MSQYSSFFCVPSQREAEPSLKKRVYLKNRLSSAESGYVRVLFSHNPQKKLGLIQRILQRGVDRKEFAPLNMQYAVYAVLAPMLFLQMMMHASAACCDSTDSLQLVPEEFLAAQVQTLLNGLLLRPASSASDKGLRSL